MKKPTRIPLEVVLKLREQGGTCRSIARDMGFSKSGIAQALSKLGEAQAVDIATRTAVRVANVKIDLIEQNVAVMASLLVDLNHIESCYGKSEMTDAERTELEQRKVRISAELRKRENLGLQLMVKMYNIRRVALFQEQTIKAIRNADPETAEKILEAIRHESALQGAVDLSRT